MQPVIYESEYNFCKILWENEPVKSTELVKLCKEKLEWKKSTTYTVIKRLSERGIIKSENAIVTSLVKKEDAQTIESVNMVDTRFDGSLPEFVAAFVRARGITDEEKNMYFFSRYSSNSCISIVCGSADPGKKIRACYTYYVRRRCSV